MGEMVDALLRDLERYVSLFSWHEANDLPLFIRPDISAHVIQERLGTDAEARQRIKERKKFAARFTQQRGRSDPLRNGDPIHPPIWDDDPEARLSLADWAVHEFGRLSDEQQLQVRRRAGTGYEDLIEGLKRIHSGIEGASTDGLVGLAQARYGMVLRVWPPQGGGQFALPDGNDLVFIRELVARVISVEVA